MASHNYSCGFWCGSFKQYLCLFILLAMFVHTSVVCSHHCCMLTELLAMFVEQENIKQLYKNRLVGAVLNGYLSLRKLVIQRTKLIDETQDNLLELLEEMTTGQ